MRLKTINVQRTFNAGNYESVRLGGEWEIGKDDNLVESIKQADNAIREVWENMKAEKHQPAKPAQPAQQEDTRPLVTFGSNMLKKIVARIGSDKDKDGNVLPPVDMETVEKAYRLTDDARKVIETAIKINK